MKARFDWKRGKRLYEDGRSVVFIAQVLGTTRKSVHAHAKAEGWQRPPKPEKKIGDARIDYIRDLSLLTEPTVTLPSVPVSDWNDVRGIYTKAVALADARNFEMAYAVAKLAKELATVLHMVEAGEEKAGILIHAEMLSDMQLDCEISQLERRIDGERTVR